MKLFLNSLKGRVISWYFISTLFLLTIISLLTYQEVKEAIYQTMDETLHSKLQIITGLLHKEGNVLELELSETVSGEYSIPRSGHYYKIVINKNETIFSPSLVFRNFRFIPNTNKILNNENKENFYFSKGPNNDFIRVLQKDMVFMGNTVQIFIAESIEENLKVLKKLYFFLLAVVPVSLLIFGIFAFYITKTSLKPLEKFSEEVNNISHKNLSKRLNLNEQISELEQLTFSFNNMLDRLDRVFTLEKLIVSEASHQLKTPVTVIKSYCDVTLLKKREIEKYIETLKIIKETSENMNQLINNMLTLARLDSGILNREHLRKIYLNECVENAILLSKTLADKKQINIKLDTLEKVSVFGDKEKLSEAILNIIENAIKYNHNNGSIEIKLKVINNLACLTISDTGMGIKPDDLKYIFDRFYRSDSVKNEEGTGLGLPIAKAITEIHQGNISVKSEFGKGTTFIINLPVFNEKF